jgi:hypothetical protein
MIYMRAAQVRARAPLTPQPQTLLREGRTQDITAQTLNSRPSVCRDPHVGVQVEALYL